MIGRRTRIAIVVVVVIVTVKDRSTGRFPRGRAVPHRIHFDDDYENDSINADSTIALLDRITENLAMAGR